MKDYQALYRKEISKFLQCEEGDIFFYWKGRVALYALLKALGVGTGDEVIVQGYTCVVVPNAIMYLGATPIYVDIDRDTYNMNIDDLKRKITAKTKVIICQNTYGLSSNLEVISQIGKERGIYTIEDCTHGFGGNYNGKPNGTFCDASFFSTQWSKPYSTGVGGFCVAHNGSIKEKLAELNKELIQPSLKECLELRVMYIVRQYIINDFTYWPLIRLYRWLSKHNFVVGSSSGEETCGIEMPKDYFKAQSKIQYKKGLSSLHNLAKVNQIRKENAKQLTMYLKNNGKTHVNYDSFENHLFLRYPVLVKDRDELKEIAEKSKVILGEWFEAPIYPAYNDYSVWGLDVKEIPNACYVSEHMVNFMLDKRDAYKKIIESDWLEYII